MQRALTVTAAIVALMGASAAPAWAATTPLGPPGAIPRQCDPGEVPNAGLYQQGGCRIQGRDGFTIAPHVVHAGGVLTGTVTPTDAQDRWDWGQFVSALGRKVSGCAPNATTCTVKVGATQSSGWEVFVFGVSVPVFGILETSVTSDYFIVDNSVFQLSGTISMGPGNPAAFALVTAGSQTAGTDAHGNYVFALPRGTYTVAPVGVRTQPKSRVVDLRRNTTGVDFGPPPPPPPLPWPGRMKAKAEQARRKYAEDVELWKAELKVYNCPFGGRILTANRSLAIGICLQLLNMRDYSQKLLDEQAGVVHDPPDPSYTTVAQPSRVHTKKIRGRAFKSSNKLISDLAGIVALEAALATSKNRETGALQASDSAAVMLQRSAIVKYAGKIVALTTTIARLARSAFAPLTHIRLSNGRTDSVSFAGLVAADRDLAAAMKALLAAPP
jgi:hypothetical protein